MKKVAVLGASGHIGKALSHIMLQDEEMYELFLFSRNKSTLGHLKEILLHGQVKVTPHFCVLDELPHYDYDVIINATGVSDLSVLQENPKEILSITEEMDQMIIEYLVRRPATLYINMSSGAVYTAPGAARNNLTPQEYYALAKKESEERHRRHSELSIVDIRIFSFFSHFVDSESHFLMSNIVSCLLSKKVFTTSGEDIIRDYVTPVDLLSLIKKIILRGKGNDYFDAYSAKPVTKFELLALLQKQYGLRVDVKEPVDSKTKGLSINVYYSNNKKAETIGYYPEFTSIDGVHHEIAKLEKLNKINN